MSLPLQGAIRVVTPVNFANPRYQNDSTHKNQIYTLPPPTLPTNHKRLCIIFEKPNLGDRISVTNEGASDRIQKRMMSLQQPPPLISTTNNKTSSKAPNTIKRSTIPTKTHNNCNNPAPPQMPLTTQLDYYLQGLVTHQEANK
jgi:hypothetical protein